MGPLEVTAGIAAVLIAVVGIWVAAVRRRDRRHRDELERRDDALVRAQVLERLARATAQWDGHADEAVTDLDVTDEDRSQVGGRSGAGAVDPAASTGPAQASDEHPRHRRPGHGIRVRRHRRA